MYFSTLVSYHSHLGEVDQVVLGVVRCSLLDEGQVSQVHSQVGNTGRVTAEDETRDRYRVIVRKCKEEYIKLLHHNV